MSPESTDISTPSPHDLYLSPQGNKIDPKSIPQSREHASQLGEAYYRGSPCRRAGHIVRLTSNGACLLCARRSNRMNLHQRRQENPEKEKARDRRKSARWRKRNPTAPRAAKVTRWASAIREDLEGYADRLVSLQPEDFIVLRRLFAEARRSDMTAREVAYWDFRIYGAEEE